MLKRIKKIQNIGRFKNCSSSSVQFEQVTLIFGRNTYGKSTLSCLLSSISSGNTEAITSRKTIPNDQQSQQAELSFMIDGQQREVSVKYSSGTWLSPLPANLKLNIFDDSFYHTNLFAGRQFSRETKDNFSSFVLGTLGVAKQQEIETKNKQKSDATRNRNDLQKAAFKDIDDLVSFIKLSPSKSKDELTQKIEFLREEYSKLSKQQKNASKIQERKECSPIIWGSDFPVALQKLNNALQASLESHHKEAQHKVAEHIKLNFKEPENAESWIRQGLAQNKAENCQFCGQHLNPDALQLLDIYRQSFDTAYESHDKNIKQELSQCQLLLTKERISSLKIAIESNNTALKSFPELEDNKDWVLLIDKITLIIDQLNEEFSQWETNQITFKEVLESVIKQKLASPHKGIDDFKFELLIQINEKLTPLAGQYNELIKDINSIFQLFKKSVIDNSIVQKLIEIEKNGKTESRELKRLDLTEQCAAYKEFDSIITLLTKEIPRLKEELLNEQSDFLDQYFDRLNQYFQMFGSRDFRLEKGLDTKGHKPIYYLKVKFHGIDVTEKNLEHTFSESDRRSLALSIFWATLDGLSEVDKKNTIVVLDDPVTSFDNHRVSSVHKEIASLSEHVRQIIILSHFEQGITSFLNTYRNKPVKLLSIERIGNSSEINVTDIDHFIKTTHEKEAHNIFSFINEQTSSHSAGDLRVFFEIEINLRFAKQLIGINEQNLSDRINKLKENSAISDSTAKQAHEWRELLNPAHHIWTGNDLEDQRHTAAQFVDFIYHELNSA